MASTELGRVTARNNLRIETARSIKNIKWDASVKDLLDVISKSSEFEDTVVKRSEKKVLNDIGKHKIRYNFEKKTYACKTSSDKVKYLKFNIHSLSVTH